MYLFYILVGGLGLERLEKPKFYTEQWLSQQLPPLPIVGGTTSIHIVCDVQCCIKDIAKKLLASVDVAKTYLVANNNWPV